MEYVAEDLAEQCAAALPYQPHVISSQGTNQFPFARLKIQHHSVQAANFLLIFNKIL